MANEVAIFGAALAGSSAAIICAFLYAYSHKRIDVIDAFWGVAILASLLAGSLMTRPLGIHSWVVIGLVSAWAIRLSYHIGLRFERSTKQDERYTKLTSKWPKKLFWLQVFLRVYVVQALLASIVAWAAVIAAAAEVIPSEWMIAGIAVWVIGFYFEVVADRQLKSFITNKANKGRVLTKGLWRYTRHPNYFGEVTMWWGIWLFSFGAGQGLAALISPLTITVLVLFVSGVPLAERQVQQRKGWEKYKQKTSVFFPLPPKS